MSNMLYVQILLFHNAFFSSMWFDRTVISMKKLKIAYKQRLRAIQYSPYFGDDELINSNVHNKYTFSILSLNCQSIHAK